MTKQKTDRDCLADLICDMEALKSKHENRGMEGMCSVTLISAAIDYAKEVIESGSDDETRVMIRDLETLKVHL